MSEQQGPEKDELRVVVARRATLHIAMCSGGEGHPHRDCYCDVYWNDDEPKAPCPECVIPPGVPTPPTVATEGDGGAL